MTAAEIIKSTITMDDLIRAYGFSKNRAGFIQCPFHAEKTASLKIYSNARGWHCFGCGAGGSVIDFVKRLFGLQFMEAIQKLNQDFQLGIPIRGASYREQEQFRQRFAELQAERTKENERRKQAEIEYDALLDEYIQVDTIINHMKPKSPEDKISEVYAWAVNRKPVIEYMFDCGRW